MRFLLLLFAFTSTVASAQSFKTAGIFGNNMVVQQKINAPVWGLAAPGEKIEIEFAGTHSAGHADGSGKWMIRLPQLEAGGPYIMIIKGGRETLTFSNVMVGEVWLASGQSNMSFSVDGVVNKDATVSSADFPNIREVHVPEQVSGTPLRDLDGLQWNVCTPQTVGNFSAVAFFFARALQKEKNIAVGIINSSNSGTPAEAWTSADMLFTHPDFKTRILDLRHHPEDWAALDKEGLVIQKEYRRIIETTKAGQEMGVHKLKYNDAAWPQANYPIVVSKLGLGGYRLLWFRKNITLPSKPKGDLVLSLGKVIQQDITYVNGIEVGRTNHQGERTYTVPAKVLKAGVNVIAIRLLSEWGYGRIGNPADVPRLHSLDKKTDINLSGAWSYNSNLEPDLPVAKDYSLEPSSLFNAMISPIIPYGIRGALWYQGEGNSGKPAQYETLLPLLFTDWRTRWQLGNFPFLIVQLPNYAPGGNNWVRMRDVQAKALQYPNTGLAVTIDLGDPNDVHPRDKEPVGERLHAVAEHVAYGEDRVYTGPIFSAAKRYGNKLRITFDQTGSGLVLKRNTPSVFLVCGEDRKFHEATMVAIEGNTVVVTCDAVPDPIAIRYAWSGNPDASLHNNEGFPAAPFRSDTFELN
ncbi:sialate O-acetylesterase [Chryseolinea lacunae]|uniref:Sialate O-acetylesterase domain-containing protein n=1 Tax=Chryseolinea lacunae TaxID=2801331 RepID=A0ABS1L0T4_9BACT|nr:sialate O-acetylesterase [Chryseolinea lacunae]MBL0745304.1 hypothetical protein [Chryseolinea lacunae]